MSKTKRDILMMVDNRKNLSALEFNIRVSDIVEEIGAPLMHNFGISHYGCIKILSDGSLLQLSNKPEWSKKYFEDQLYNDPEIFTLDKVPNDGDTYISFLTGTPVGEHNLASCFEHKIWHIMLIYERVIDHGYMWFFCTEPENYQMLDFYVNNFHIFKHFITFFREKAAPLLKESGKDKLIIPTLNHKTKNDLFYCEQQKINQFFEETKITKYFGREKLKDTGLSPREFEFLKNLSEGKTTKEIGKLFQVSPRTVEKHFENIKAKTNLHTKSELIRLFGNEYL